MLREESPHATTRPEPPKDRLRPWLLGAACGLWVVRPLYPSEGAAFRGDGLPVVMLWIALAVFWLLGAVGRREFRLRFGWIDAGLLLAVGLHTLSALWAASHASPRPAVNMLWEWIGLGVGFFLTRQLVDGPREARAIVAVMLALAVALACYGPYQTYVEMAKDRQLNRENQDEALRRAGVWYPEGAPERETFTNRLESIEPLATFALTNSLAGYLAPWLVVTLGIGVSAIGIPSKGRRVWLAGLGVAALTVAACLLLTRSRSGCLAALTGIVLLGIGASGHKIRMPGRVLAVGAAVLALVIAGAIVSGGPDVPVLAKAAKSLGYRLQYWRSTAQMIAEHPLLGCGPGNFKNAYTAYKLPEASEEVADPHNFLLEIWATAGTPAMLAFVAALGGFFWVVLKGTPAARQNALLRQTGVSALPSEAGDHPLFVLGGGLLGFLAAQPIALVTAAPPKYAVLYIGLPPAIATAAILAGWVDRGRMAMGLLAVGVLVLLVDLTAAGGIGFASVAGTFWILAALGLNLRAPDAGRLMPRWAALGLLTVTTGLSVSCYLSGYDPVLRYRAAMESASQDSPRREEYLWAAASADPLSADPWNALAALALDKWQQTLNGGRLGAAGADAPKRLLRRFGQCTAAAIQRAPNDAPLWFAAAERYKAVFERTKDRSYLEEGIKQYLAAIRLYPNKAAYHGRLALAIRDSGDMDSANEEAETALRLDDDNPHRDKKLDQKLRKSLERIVSNRN